MAPTKTNTGGSVRTRPRIKPSPNAPVRRSPSHRTLPHKPSPDAKPSGGKSPEDT